MNKYDYVLTKDGELYHYGVLGMKWGIRRARKRGESYTYKSIGQKKYEKRLAKQTKKGASEGKIASTSNQLDVLKERDRKRQQYADSTSVGKAIAQNLLLTAWGAGSYQRFRSAGMGRVGSALISGFTPVPVSILLSRGMEKTTARNTVNFRNEVKRSVND